MDKADKLLERMRASKAGWRPNDLDDLYKGFGFETYEGRRHTMYIHPKYQGLRATVSRHRTLAIGYIQHALKLIEQLKTLEGE
ncbi:MAG: hypothetical protein A3F87_01285 [Omnitrophica WOR_2 bacterium RIFCSPLOWO2_12_FULL_51_24]|nr:MAG: hypothetical protein A3I43_00330 [Omnitrophica WOR_2 bacterium RIFCSPLOWO2_02_FULL_50_19]OGX42408.1 MAG: hypothetical protein A3F87_01285 [Omnitrophica WOR_2 bacterium RIFCSPLOWO2_12_FULL_51_24]